MVELSSRDTAQTAIKIYLQGTRRNTYTATLSSPTGEVLMTRANEPQFSVCRILKARGMRGRVDFYSSERPDVVRFSVKSIDLAAALTVRENEEEGPYFAKYRAFNGLSRATGPHISPRLKTGADYVAQSCP
jgi:hypothetical protein